MEWNDDKIPLKTIGAVHDRDMCNMLYSMHTDSPLLREAEERQNLMLDCNYSKVDVDAMVAQLDIDNRSKEQLRTTLRKFESELFSGGLGKLKHCKPAHMKLKEGFVPYKGRYYNLPKSYEYTAKKEIERMVDIGVLKELPWHNDSPWASPFFAYPRRLVTFG